MTECACTLTVRDVVLAERGRDHSWEDRLGKVTSEDGSDQKSRV